MAHARQQIRDAVVTALKTISGYSTKVHSGRVYALPKDDVARIAVYSKSEEVDSYNMGASHSQTRSLEINIEAYKKANMDLDDALDDVCALIENKMAEDPTFSGIAMESEYQGTQIELSEGETSLGVAILTYNFTYEVDITDVETAL